MIRIFFFLLTVILLQACTENQPEAPCDKNAHYIHVAHTRLRDTVNQKVDPRIEAIDFSKFDMTLLGGDLCEETSKEAKTLDYLQPIFDLKSPNTLWALGNHDNAHLEYVEAATERPYIFSHHKNGITFIVLYTQENEDWMCQMTGNQLDLFKSVTDTIQSSSHLVIMTHKLIWIYNNEELKEHQGTNYYNWSCNYRIHETNWLTDYLPKLQEIQNKGIQVICLAGDIGNNVQEFEERTSDGIYYLASGINPEDEDVKFLQFDHDLEKRNLDWRFVELEKFLDGGQVICK